MAKILRCTSMGNQWHAVLMNKQEDLGGRLTRSWWRICMG